MGRVREALGLFMVCVLWGCDLLPQDAQPGIAPSQKSSAPPRPGLVATDTPQAALDADRAQWRLAPDRRFVHALGRIGVFTAGKPDPVEVKFGAGQFLITAAGHPVGTVDELPGFDPLFELVAARADHAWKKRIGDGPSPGTPRKHPVTALPGPESLLSTLTELDAVTLGNELPNAELLSAASLAWGLIHASMVDALGVGEPVAGQAIAVLAMAEAARGGPWPRGRALLARSLGYAGAAERAAKGLPQDDPIALYAMGRHGELLQRRRAGWAEGLLAIRSVQEMGTRKDRLALARALGRGAASYPELALVAAERWGGAASWHMAVSSALSLQRMAGRSSQQVVALSLSPVDLGKQEPTLDLAADLLKISANQLIADVERSTRALHEKPSGPYLAHGILAQYYAAQFTSAVHYLLRFHLDLLGSSDVAGAMVAIGSGDSRLGEQLERYTTDLIRAERRTLPLKDLVRDMKELDELGTGGVMRLAEAVFERSSRDADANEAALALVQRCDSRLDCRWRLARIAHAKLGERVVDERLSRSVAQAAPSLYPIEDLRDASAQKDAERFVRALADPRIHVEYRMDWLVSPNIEWLGEDRIAALARQTWKSAPDDYDVVYDYSMWLVEQERTRDAISVIDAFLARDEPMEGTQEVVLRTLRAKALHLGGDPGAAWVDIEPLLPSMYGGALWRAALIKLALNEPQAAIALARRRLERYQVANSVYLLCQVYWRTGKHEEAAELLEQWSNRLSSEDWREVAKAFDAAFRDGPTGPAVTAAQALGKRRLDPTGLTNLLLEESVTPRLIAAVAPQIPWPGILRATAACKLYGAVRGLEGEEAARKALAKGLEGVPPGVLPMAAYLSAQYDLVWDYGPDPAPGDAPVWLLRAAAYLRSDKDVKARHRKLLAHYQADSGDRDVLMGRYLMGLSDEQAVWDATRDSGRSVAAWVFGQRADSEGAMEQAVGWYRIAEQTGRQTSGEVQWSRQALLQIQRDGDSLAQVAEQRKAAWTARAQLLAGQSR